LLEEGSASFLKKRSKKILILLRGAAGGVFFKMHWLSDVGWIAVTHPASSMPCLWQ
jgi:hypothetical protein